MALKQCTPAVGAVLKCTTPAVIEPTTLSRTDLVPSPLQRHTHEHHKLLDHQHLWGRGQLQLKGWLQHTLEGTQGNTPQLYTGAGQAVQAVHAVWAVHTVQAVHTLQAVHTMQAVHTVQAPEVLF